MKKFLIYLWFVVGGLLGFSSCSDDVLIPGDETFIPEGNGTISATVNFKPFVGTLNATRSAGDAIKEVESLYVLLYDEDGNLVDNFDAKAESENFKEDKHNYNNELSAETEAPCITFNKLVPYGKYYIYAVANVPDFLTKYAESIQTVGSLKKIRFAWDKQDVSQNSQMFGYFKTEKTNDMGDFEAPLIVINQTSINLHAWIRRLASKVTVAFDGSHLNENVYITVKSVQIKDIPDSCWLGTDYAVQKEEDMIAEGEIILYGSTDADYPVITRGGVNHGSKHIEGWDKPYDPNNESAHTESSEALYFYENLQGEGNSDTDTDKSINRLDYIKKGKPFGTYIEVKAYYENKAQYDVSSGEIVYRFMLGKDVKTDYNAERNHHYMLTLCFNKDANDVDWRIEYKEEDGIYVPNPYYISYLYSQEMQMPLKVVINQNDEIKSLTAEIIENNWEPDGNTAALGESYFGNTTTTNTYKAINKDGEVVEGTIKAGNTKIPWVGFLSLRDETFLNGGKIYLDGGFGADIKAYVEGTNKTAPHKWWVNKSLGKNNEYSPVGTENTGVNTKSVIYEIPFYTRVKQLYSVTGFTGNNPYSGYERTARVKFTVKTNNGSTYTQEVKIIQVKRLVNPTGIWREKDNATPFNVVLQEQDGFGGIFHDLISDGPWSVATIGGDWFSVSPTSGVTGSRVSFTYAPNGTTEEPRCGIIKVNYNNNSCSHLIFVRQGYEPIRISDDGPKWFSFNLKKVSETDAAVNELTTSPLDEGSLYRYGKLWYPIAEKNNLNDLFAYGVNPGTNEFAMEGEGRIDTYNWSDIGSMAKDYSIELGLTKAVMPTEAQWLQLKNMKQGYGVLYGDGATTVAQTPTDAFGYRSAIGEQTLKRGMRGVFAYNKDTGANVFFPIGAMGYGHRKENTSGDADGILRYGQMNASMLSASPTYAPYRPLLNNLYSQYGAIYWTGENGIAWDINYDQLDFNSYEGNAWDKDSKTSDACFIRPILYEGD